VLPQAQPSPSCLLLPPARRYLIGYVPQDDIVHEDLTVSENMAYAARLRLPGSTGRRQLEQAVQDVLNMLGLGAVQDSIVGSVGSRGISGGQRKRCAEGGGGGQCGGAFWGGVLGDASLLCLARHGPLLPPLPAHCAAGPERALDAARRVNIGMELVVKPSILYMDEPTSGLDAAVALEVRCSRPARPGSGSLQRAGLLCWLLLRWLAGCALHAAVLLLQRWQDSAAAGQPARRGACRCRPGGSGGALQARTCACAWAAQAPAST
jgi:hypothetical protein